MTQPRRDHVVPNQAGTYHCVARCVRRSWLFGFDHYSSKSFDHRKHWIEHRLTLLSEIFAVSVHSYAVMSNHFHVVCSMIPEHAARWTSSEIATRWCKLYPKQNQVEQLERVAEIEANPKLVERFRGHLSNLSWLMKSIVEPIARRANVEDQVKGRFWEGRFKSQLLMSEKAILAAMTYVDLNPIRAEIATSVRGSKHTSVRKRAIQLAGQLEQSKLPLRPILGIASSHTPSLSQADYIDLVDYTGRQIAPGKRGSIKATEPPALEKLGLKPDHWIHRVKAFSPGFVGHWFRFVGELEDVADKAAELQKRALFGVGLARRLKKA
jgi:REP element-mobilizing transposase RayT